MKFLTKRRMIAVFATAAFLLHVLLPFFAVYHVPTSQDAKNMASLFGDKVLLCTAEGFKLVSWEDIINGKQEHKPHKQYQCALCYVAAHGQGLKPPPLNGLIASSQNAIRLSGFKPDRHIVVSDGEWRSFLTRSPPISFVI